METRTALDIIKALNTLADATGIDYTQIPARICFFDDEAFKVFTEAQSLAIAYRDSSIVERGALLGIEITESNGVYESSFEL